MYDILVNYIFYVSESLTVLNHEYNPLVNLNIYMP
uniref:Uncharacterized protein n=1 Tax=Bostrychia simpliciuscula TaxID=324754 RepID=A0A1Z1M8H8_9FLOR|nr:hypothetical protein [Bostrychia simpliciuscula]ARW62064.1 hypothetical protein [Bostrychia simpliciuscula]